MKKLLSNQQLFRGILFLTAALIVYLATGHFQLTAGIDNGDKISHLAAFFLLSFLADRSFPHKFTNLLVPLLVIYGGAIEFIQALLPHRTASFADFIADLSGIWLYFISLLLIRRIDRHAA